MTEEARKCVKALQNSIRNGFYWIGNAEFSMPCKWMIHLIESLSAQLDQVTRERDAAVEELSYTRKCSICKNHLSEGGDCYGNHKCGNGNPDWQWRGVEVEDVHA